MNEIIFNFESTKFLEISLRGKNYTIDEYKFLINTSQFYEFVRKDFLFIEKYEAADTFFQEHTLFIINSFLSGKQILGIEMWLSLLERIEKIDASNYKKIHKGTAFYHAGIYSLFANHFDKAFQWLEYALEEDIKTGRIPLPGTPAMWILTFDTREEESFKGNDYGYTQKLLYEIKGFLDRIRTYDSRFSITGDLLRSIIISKIVTNNSSRPLRSAWAALLASFLEYGENERFLKISPQSKEAQFTVNNFLVNLTLILETLIKKSPKANNITLKKENINELYEKIIAPNYGFTYEKSFFQSQISKRYSCMLSEIEDADKKEDKIEVSFITAQRVRNKSHHIFNEEFIDNILFETLCLRIYYAIFSVIEKLYS